MNDKEPQLHPASSLAEDLPSEKRERKLELEIESLEKKNRWESVSHFMPIIATLLGIAGLFFTVLQAQCQRGDAERKDRTSRYLEQTAKFQNQLRLDSDEIVGAARNQRQTASRLLFLLGDMETLLASKVNESQTLAEVFPNFEPSFTESLVLLVRDDYDFVENPRDVGLANVISRHWSRYSAYLGKNPRMLDYILYNYTRALQNLQDQNPGYLECLRVDKQTKQVTVCLKYQRQKNEPTIYNYFTDIVAGFIEHIKILGNQNLSDHDRKRKEKILLDFQEALCNRTVSEHFLGTYVPGGTCGGSS